MIEPDVIGERKPTNHTPTIALGLAALLLLVVGALSYRDSVRSSLEKEYAEKENQLRERMGLPSAPTAAEAQSEAAPRPSVTALAPAPPPSAVPPAPANGATVLYDAQGNPVYLSGTRPAAPATTAGLQAEAGLPAPEDPDIARLQRTLDQVRAKGQSTEQRFNELAGSGDPLAAEAAAMSASGAGGGEGGNATISSDLPDFLRVAVENPPGGNPEMEARLSRVRAQVMAAPSLAKVTSYDKDWGIVTFNAGSGQGVKVDQRFAVRRGGEVLGWVKVNEVFADEAIATLVTKNADSDTAVKPGVGDDLIDFELF